MRVREAVLVLVGDVKFKPLAVMTAAFFGMLTGLYYIAFFAGAVCFATSLVKWVWMQ